MHIIRPYIISFFIFVAIFHPGCKQQKADVIEHEVLRTWNIPAGGIGMDILVSEQASKGDILKLASELRKENLSRGTIVINIFDSREAWQNRDNQNYPQEKYDRHFLVQVIVNPKTGYDKITWDAKGRDH